MNMNQKGFIQIPFLILIVAVLASVSTGSIVYYKTTHKDSDSLTANISSAFDNDRGQTQEELLTPSSPLFQESETPKHNNSKIAKTEQKEKGSPAKQSSQGPANKAEQTVSSPQSSPPTLFVAQQVIPSVTPQTSTQNNTPPPQVITQQNQSPQLEQVIQQQQTQIQQQQQQINQLQQIILPPPPPDPEIISFSASKTEITEGERIILSWSSQNAVFCKSSFPDPNSQLPTSHSSFEIALSGGSKEITLTCWGEPYMPVIGAEKIAKLITKSIFITVNPKPAISSVSFNISQTSNPQSVQIGQSGANLGNVSINVSTQPPSRSVMIREIIFTPISTAGNVIDVFLNANRIGSINPTNQTAIDGLSWYVPSQNISLQFKTNIDPNPDLVGRSLKICIDSIKAIDPDTGEVISNISGDLPFELSPVSIVSD